MFCVGPSDRGERLRFKDLKDPRRLRAVDRESWPALDKVKFSVRVTGCSYATAPFWFGQAFEQPPFFTYSMTTNVPASYEGVGIEGDRFKFTCGIDHWFIDERGCFLGANVWFSVPELSLGDAGQEGGEFDLQVGLSWEGFAYKAYFHIFPNSHKREGPERVFLPCAEQVVLSS